MARHLVSDEIGRVLRQYQEPAQRLRPYRRGLYYDGRAVCDCLKSEVRPALVYIFFISSSFPGFTFFENHEASFISSWLPEMPIVVISGQQFHSGASV